MAPITVYFDDSGTHPEANTAIAAAYLSTAEMWRRFEDDWRAVADAEKFKTFHMADFAAGQKDFVGWSDDKRKRVLRKLCALINIRIRTGFVAAIKKKDYDELIVGDFREYCGKYHYTFGLRSCANGIGQWWNSHGKPDSTVRYVFDRMTKGKSKTEVVRVMDTAVEKSKKLTFGTGVIAFGGYSFEDKTEFLPLQAVDILAWSVFQYSQLLTAGRSLGWIARESLAILLKAPVKKLFIQRDNLEKWAANEKEELKRRAHREGHK